MQEQFDNIQKLWALKSIVDVAVTKYHKICEGENQDSEKKVSELIKIVSDATNKLSHMRWTDNYGLYCGVRIYTTAINNL
jgi:hypothetical protein